jgi:hypothetical protein
MTFLFLLVGLIVAPGFIRGVTSSGASMVQPVARIELGGSHLMMNLDRDQFLDQCFVGLIVVFAYIFLSLFSLAWQR